MAVIVCVEEVMGIEGKAGMAEHYQLPLFSIQRTGVNAALTVIFQPSEVPRPEEKVIAIGEKHRPAVGLVVAAKDTTGDGCCTRSIRVDAPNRASGIGLVQN